jgi:hypothetical protein
MTDLDDLRVTHLDGCWMDPRPHEHRIHLLEAPRPEPDPRFVLAGVVAEPGGPRAVVGIPRPPTPSVRRRSAHV